MLGAARLYTPAEAGGVSGLKLKAAHNAIDKRVVEPVANARVAPLGEVKRIGPAFWPRSRCSGGHGSRSKLPDKKPSPKGRPNMNHDPHQLEPASRNRF